MRRNIIFTALVFGVLVKPRLRPNYRCARMPTTPSWAAPLTSRVGGHQLSAGGTTWLWWLASSVICWPQQGAVRPTVSPSLALCCAAVADDDHAGDLSRTRASVPVRSPAHALAAEVVPLRDRGRYQGVLGAVFGVNTVTGPLLAHRPSELAVGVWIKCRFPDRAGRQPPSLCWPDRPNRSSTTWDPGHRQPRPL